MDNLPDDFQAPDPPPLTLGEVQRRALELFAHCPKCRRIVQHQAGSRWLEQIVQRLGDLPLEAAAARAVCQNCGHRGARLEARLTFGAAQERAWRRARQG